MRRRDDRRDTNERSIIQYLERVGCSVKQISQSGVPDLLVGFLGYNILMEVKANSGTLTSAQETFFAKWIGQKAIVKSRTDARKVLKDYMPVRVYICKECGIFERKERITSTPLTKCPTCDTIVKQIYTAPSILFRGNGWGFQTDEKSNN